MSPDDSRTDAELLRASRLDATAFRAFYDRHAPDLLSWLRLELRDFHLAEDLLEETFARAWLAAGRFRDERGGSAAPWLFGIARHVLLDSHRKQQIETRARTRIRLEVHPSVFNLPEEVADRLDAQAQRSRLTAALKQLPDGERLAIGLRIFGNAPYEQIAVAIGSSPTSARMRVMRGLRHLRGLLEEAEV